MELVLTTLPLFNSVTIMALSIITAMMLLMFMVSFMFSFPTTINCNIQTLEQIKQYDSPLSEFQYRTDNKEHEYKERIDRKRSLAYFY